MRLGIVGMVIGICCGAAGSAAAQTPFERQVLDALNAARQDPAAYAASLRQYRTYFHANLVRYPGQSDDVETSEGVAVVDETIAYLGHQPALSVIADAPTLAAAAAEHSADQAASGDIGHDGSDGTSPEDRVRKHGGGTDVSEVIAYGPVDAADVIRQLIVDDGVADRGHRSIIFAPELRFAGVSCAPHPEYRTVCVIDMGTTPDGRYPAQGARIAAR